MIYTASPAAALVRFVVLVGCATLLQLPESAYGQTVKPAKKAVANDMGPPPPEDITLEAKDGAVIRCTFYPGTAGKKAIPFILIHAWEGQRGDFHSLAMYLQSLGHASIAPDLRGHGQSTVYKLPNGDSKEFNRDRFRPVDLEAMVLDVEATKRVLLEKNNAGELNIESLCVVGAEMGCIVGMKWAMRDWNAPILPAFKQGQDVKALVLLSPLQTFKGLTLRDALAHPVIRGQLSTLIVVGGHDTKSNNEAKRLHSTLQSFHAKVPSDPQERIKKQDLYLLPIETSLVGTKLLEPGLMTMNAIKVFIERRLLAHQDGFAWSDRKNPLGN